MRPQGGVACQPQDRLAQFRRRRRRDKHACITIDYRIEVATDRRRYRRDAVRQCLEQRIREALLMGGQKRDVHRRKKKADVGSLAQPGYVVGDAFGRGLP